MFKAVISIAQRSCYASDSTYAAGQFGVRLQLSEPLSASRREMTETRLLTLIVHVGQVGYPLPCSYRFSEEHLRLLQCILA